MDILERLENLSFYIPIEPFEFPGASSEFGPRLQKYTNSLVYFQCPITASLTLKYIDDELNSALETKNSLYDKLSDKYSSCSSTAEKAAVSIVHTIYNDDFEMSIAENVPIIPTALTKLLQTASQNNLIRIILRTHNEYKRGREVEKNFRNVYELLEKYRNNQFTQLEFINEGQQSINAYMLSRIVKVWQIFEQFFKQFDYLDYLEHYEEVRRYRNTKFARTVLGVLMAVEMPPPPSSSSLN